MDPPRRCIICDSPAPPDAYHERGPYRLVRCPACRLVFQDPQPDPDVLERSYYHDRAYSQALLGHHRRLTLDRGRENLKLLRTVPGALRPGARLLDVGCSSGAFLELAAAAGLNGTGIEIGATTAAGARERGLDVRTGTLDQARSAIGAERFDLITFWDVLEHLRDPRLELSLARELLAPGGHVAATFPNVDGWYPRTTYFLLARTVGRWEHPELPLHLYDFSPTTARRLLNRCGFQPTAVRTAPIPFDHFRGTSLSIAQLGGGRRARALRLAFEALRVPIYPVARLVGRSNSVFVAASPGEAPTGGSSESVSSRIR